MELFRLEMCYLTFNTVNSFSFLFHLIIISFNHTKSIASTTIRSYPIGKVGYMGHNAVVYQNGGLQIGYEIIDDIKEELERQCPGVSCADILALAARDAVFFAGGPVYDIPKGRKDGTRSKIEDTINLPSPNFNASDLIKMFGQHGFSAQEMVALSGAHTIGVARCSSFKNRLTKVDPNLNSEFAKTLSRTCSAGDNAEQPFDETRDDFDNLYFDALVSGNGVLTSDQTLFTSPRTRNFVNSYAQNQALFFLDFQQAMVKMSLLDIKEGSKGQVRDNCRKIN
ncbi:peroxidase 47-like isoform X3 [Arachis ipaensis]|uniref:peroxidase 47-like isoform X3 n=1 Tax=Arachis ipaensis TaxID=130454 RepID=UPI000A2B37C2|nr:peroxidase 47-like isoform X3 [Arachis ipaensis]XP_025656605.1 peroxidase 47 isoform X3 [Arachis hypogaea]